MGKKTTTTTINKQKQNHPIPERIKPNPIQSQIGRNLNPIWDQMGSKTVTFEAAHTGVAYKIDYNRRNCFCACLLKN